MAYRLMTPQEITDAEIQEVLDMESLVYDESEQQTLERCRQFFSVNRGIYLFFKDADTGKIVGNMNFMPVNDRCYRMIRSGRFVEKDILPDMILPQGSRFYFSGITIRGDLRNSGLLACMLRAFLPRTRGMEKMLADAVTERGARLCRMFGMKEVCRSSRGSTIYEKVFREGPIQ